MVKKVNRCKEFKNKSQCLSVFTFIKNMCISRGQNDRQKKINRNEVKTTPVQ